MTTTSLNERLQPWTATLCIAGHMRGVHVAVQSCVQSVCAEHLELLWACFPFYLVLCLSACLPALSCHVFVCTSVPLHAFVGAEDSGDPSFQQECCPVPRVLH